MEQEKCFMDAALHSFVCDRHGRDLRVGIDPPYNVCMLSDNSGAAAVRCGAKSH